MRRTRDEWRLSHRRGKLFASFAPGESIFCPRTKIRQNGKAWVCAGYLGETPRDVRALVRTTMNLPHQAEVTVEHRTCPSCRQMAELLFTKVVVYRETA